MPSIPSLIDLLNRLENAMLEGVEALVTRESPSRDKHALDELARYIKSRFETLGMDVERIPNETGGDHLRIHLGGRTDGAAQGLVLCHYDTVWPAGTIARLPFRAEGGRAFGAGIYDMKASIILAEFAARAWRTLGHEPPRPVVLLITSDEEIGSPTSRKLIESEALKSEYVLVLEPPLDGGKLKTARKGVGKFTIEVQGRAAHAGVEPEKGISAVVELAHQIIALTRLADPERGTTFNVGMIQGGTTPNVVPATATAVIDARVATLAEAHRADDALHALAPVLPGAKLIISGGFSRPPMERTEKVATLYERVRLIARTLGMELGEGSTGGGSDGNFTAAAGVPTIDGLGVPGGGAHAETEHIIVAELPKRVALLAALLLEL